jgi:hypothetical protein
MDLDSSFAVDENKVSGCELLVPHVGPCTRLVQALPWLLNTYPKFPFVKVRLDKKPPLPFSI